MTSWTCWAGIRASLAGWTSSPIRTGLKCPPLTGRLALGLDTWWSAGSVTSAQMAACFLSRGSPQPEISPLHPLLPPLEDAAVLQRIDPNRGVTPQPRAQERLLLRETEACSRRGGTTHAGCPRQARV